MTGRMMYHQISHGCTMIDAHVADTENPKSVIVEIANELSCATVVQTSQ